MSDLLLKYTLTKTVSADGTVLATERVDDPIVHPLPGPGEDVKVAFVVDEQWWSTQKGRETVLLNLAQMSEYLQAVGSSLEEATVVATHNAEQQTIYVRATVKVPAAASAAAAQSD